MTLHTPLTTPTDAPWLQQALHIGERLHRQARWQGRHPHWWGDELAGHDGATARVVQQATGPALYGGSAGIGWFLAHLGQEAAQPRLRRTGVAALQGALAAWQAPLAAGDLGLYTGATGVAWVALQTGQALGHRGLQDQAWQLGQRVAQACLAGSLPAESDLISGLAGTVVGLVALLRSAPRQASARSRQRLQGACHQLCGHLLQRRCDQPLGIAWPEPQAEAGAPCLCGLGHGASGMAWALHEAAQLPGGAPWQHWADEALAYERSCWLADAGNWPDLRANPQPGQQPGCMNAWCHGAVGIGALRWLMWARQPDPALLAEAGAALLATRGTAATAQAALQAGQASDTSLCHGLAGSIELLQLAHEVSGQAEHRRAAHNLGRLALRVAQSQGGQWPVGLPGGRQVPGLMLGDAGVGAMLLRLHRPQAMPGLLLPGAPGWQAAYAVPPSSTGPVPDIASACA